MLSERLALTNRNRAYALAVLAVLIGNPAPASAQNAPFGWFDAATDTYNAGWAIDPDSPNTPLSIHIYVNGRFADLAVASSHRGDLQAVFGFSGNHSFHAPHTGYGSGSASVTIYAIGVNAAGQEDGVNSLIGSRSVQAADVSCNNLPALYRGWCTSVPHYWTSKSADTEWLVAKDLRVGVNKSYGGTMFELNGRDRGWNLIDEQGGAAIQMSVWGYSNEGNSGKGTPCPGVPGHPVWTNESPYNPIQAQQINCSWALSEDSSNNVAGWDRTWTRVTTELHNAVNFTGSAAMTGPAGTPGMVLRQETHLENGAYLRLEYKMANYTIVPITDPHPQEVPAVFLNLGTETSKLEYYGQKWDPVLQAFSGPTDVHVSDVTTSDQKLSFKGRVIPNSSIDGNMLEGWYSVCSADYAHCVTIASRLNSNPDVFQAQVKKQAHGAVYASLMSYYPLLPGTQRDTTVYVFPFRWNESVGGKTVRQWISCINGAAC